MVRTPLLAESVPAGCVMLSTLPALRVMAPRLSESGLAVAFAVRVMAETPGLIVVPLNAWLFVVDALPVRFSVPPPRTRAELLLMILVAGAVAAEKSNFSVPALTDVTPV